MSTNTIVPASQITALKSGLDSILKPIQQALQTRVYVENLPIVGSLISTAAAKGSAALQQIGSLESGLFSALNSYNNVGTDVATLQTTINNALVSAGFPAGGVTVGLNANGTLTVTLSDSAKSTFATSLGSNFGLPGLGFQTSGSATTQLTYALNVTGTVNTSGNFSVSTPNNAPALTVGLGVTAPTFAVSASLGSSDSTLGALRFGALDQGSALQGSFSLDTSGNATFTGNANLNVHLTSDMGTAALPSISADLVGGWSFATATVDPNNAASFGNAPTIALDNVTYKLGDFVDNFIDPILSQANTLLQSTPIQTALKLFQTPVDFLGGGLAGDPNAKGNNGLLGSLWTKLDVAGAVDASGADIADGQITLVDFLKLAGVDVTPIVQFLTAVQDVQTWVTALTNASFGSTTYDLGSFSIPDDVRGAVEQIANVVPVQTKAAQDLGTFLDSLPGASPAASGGMTAAQALQALLNSKIFSFPIISNPIQAVQFLLGGTVDLFDANLPPASINIGAINSAGVPTSLDTLFSLPIPIPFIPPNILSLDLTLGAAFQGSAGIAFGYDTSGLTAFAASGYKDPTKILNGLFVEDPTVNGTVAPVVQLEGAVQLGATLEAGFIGSAGAGGNIGGVLDLSFAQPGKNYLTTLASALKTDPFSIFDASGRVTAGFEAAAKVLFFPTWTFYPTPVTLAQFSTAATATTSSVSGPVIPAATNWIGATQGAGNVKTNWSPAFAAIGLTNYYGDATIKAGNSVLFNGTAVADMTSLSLAANSIIVVDHSVMALEGNTQDTTNSGTIVLDHGANLLVQGGLDNVGEISPINGTVIVSGLVHLYGGGALLNTGSNQAWLTGADANALLINSDNLIGGAGTISVAVLNQGKLLTDNGQRLVLSASDVNAGMLIASGNSAAAGTARAGALEIQQSLDNTGGTLVAEANGQILLDDGVTLYGGLLITGQDGSAITTAGSVVINGGTSGINLSGAIIPRTGSTLTLTGSITALNEKGIIVSASGTVLLSALTLHNAILDSEASPNGSGGTIAVSGAATLDGLFLAGTLEVGNGNTLVVDGAIDPVVDSGVIELSGGTLIVGDAISDAASFGIAGTAPTTGTLLLDDGAANLVTGADAGSSLTNSWLIAGSGTLGNGQLAIINTTAGTIGAIGAEALVLKTGSAVLNAGLIGALAGTLDLQSNVANAGGTIGALAGVVLLDGATIGGGTIATTLGGSIRVAGHGRLDGTASTVTIAAAGQVAVDAGDTLTVAGTITNHGTITVLGNAIVGSLATLGASGSVTLTGGGVVALADSSGNGSSTSQAITGSATGTLDNIDNQIRGYGEIGIGDGSLTLINEAKGVINATAGGGRWC